MKTTNLSHSTQAAFPVTDVSSFARTQCADEGGERTRLISAAGVVKEITRKMPLISDGQLIQVMKDWCPT
jgi:hypothetical protein